MAAKTSQDGRDDSTDDPLAAGCADRDHAGQDAAQVSVPGTTGNFRRFPPVDSAAAPPVAGVAAALASAIAIQRRNEAKRPRLQRWPAHCRTGGPRRTSLPGPAHWLPEHSRTCWWPGR